MTNKLVLWLAHLPDLNLCDMCSRDTLKDWVFINPYAENSLKESIRNVVFKFTSIILTCNEHVCSVWRVSASQSKPFPGPNINYSRLMHWAEMRGPRLTADWHSRNRCIAYCHEKKIVLRKEWCNSSDKTMPLCCPPVSALVPDGHFIMFQSTVILAASASKVGFFVTARYMLPNHVVFRENHASVEILWSGMFVKE